MTKTTIAAALTAVLLAWAVTPVSAHHGGRGHFDFEQDIVIEDAVVTKFRLVNPHTYIYFEVTNESGDVEEWRCEMTAGTRLRRQGWSKDQFVPGQVVTVVGYPAKREQHTCKANSFVLEDGSGLTYIDLGLSVSSASKDDVEARLARLPNGQPNLSGPWSPPMHRGMPLAAGAGGVGSDRYQGRVPGGRAAGGGFEGTGALQPTEAGIKAGEGYEDEFDNPVLSCHPLNIIFGWQVELSKFVQHDDKIVLTYGFMDLERTIYLDQSEHPADIEPSVGGHSIGHWEEDVLVVDTVGFEPGVLMSRQKIMHSDQLHVVERFEIREDGKLHRSFVAEDPLYLEGPWTGTMAADLTTEKLTPYDCIPLEGKNNQRPGSQ